MFDNQAAVGLHQLNKIAFFWQRRKRNVVIYNAAFSEIPAIILLAERADVKHAHHLYPILVRTEDLTVDRYAILKSLADSGIGVGVRFRALYFMSFYRQTFGFETGDFPNAEYASDRLISLPLYPNMSEQDVERVIAAVKNCLQRAKKKLVG